MERARYLALRWGTALLSWAWRRFTPAGRLVLALLAVSALVGFDTYKNLAYQIFTLSLALLAVAVPAGLLFRTRIYARRRLPRFGTAGQALPYEVEAAARGGAASPAMTLREDIPEAWPSWESFRLSAAPGDEKLAWFDRGLGYTRWLRLLRSERLAQADPIALPDISAGASLEAPGRLVPRRRGKIVLSGLEASRPDPLGLFNGIVRVPVQQSVLILPKRYPVPRIRMPGKARYQQGGVSLSSSIGESQEFVSLRDYRPGDPPRKLHWRSLAKAGKLIVKEYQDEYFVRHALALDTFAGASDPEAFEEAVSVAASLACSVLTQESLLDLLFVGAETYCFTAGRGLGGTDRMLEVLASVEPCRNKPFSELKNAVARRHSALSGCLCVLLAFDDERRSLLSQLRSLGTPVKALVMGRKAQAPAEGAHFIEVGNAAEGLSKLA